jgi:hypothetical protein
MRIVIGNIPDDATEESVREALSGFALGGPITINRDGSAPTAIIEVVMTHEQAQALARRIQGRLHQGRALTAWVPSMGWK